VLGGDEVREARAVESMEVDPEVVIVGVASTCDCDFDTLPVGRMTLEEFNEGEASRGSVSLSLGLGTLVTRTVVF